MSDEPGTQSTPGYKPGDPVSGAITLDGLVSEVFPTISPSLGAISYDWSDYRTIIGTFPNANTQHAQSTAFIKIVLGARAYDPDYIIPAVNQ